MIVIMMVFVIMKTTVLENTMLYIYVMGIAHQIMMMMGSVTLTKFLAVQTCQHVTLIH